MVPAIKEAALAPMWLAMGSGPGGGTGGAALFAKSAARGRASEASVLLDLGLPKNTTPVTSAEGASIPDALTSALSVEIKDTKAVFLTRQLRIQADAATASGRQPILVTGAKTHVSVPAQRAFQVIPRSDLGPK